MDDKKIIGENIRSLRKERGMTQALLAKAIGVSVATLSSYETGKTAPPISLIRKMALTFGTTIDDLLGPQPDAEDTFGYVD